MDTNIATPVFAHADLLEDAFKTPIVDEEGRSESLPTIWNDYSYRETEEGILIITNKSAKIASTLYSKYLDEKALVWDATKQRLLLYIPDPQNPKMAFKGSGWSCAKKLKSHNGPLDLADVYLESIRSLSE